MVPRCCDTVYSHQLRPQCQDMWKCNYRKGNHEATKDWGRRAWRKAETEQQQEDRARFWEGTQVPGTGTCQVVYANMTYGGVRDHRGDPQDSDDLPWLQTGTQLHLERGSPPSPQPTTQSSCDANGLATHTVSVRTAIGVQHRV